MSSVQDVRVLGPKTAETQDKGGIWFRLVRHVEKNAGNTFLPERKVYMCMETAKLAGKKTSHQEISTACLLGLLVGI